MNTEHTNQSRQAANAAFEQWWQRHGMEDPMDDEDRQYATASSWARRGYLAAMQAQQAAPAACAVCNGTGIDVQFGDADDAIEQPCFACATKSPAVAVAVPEVWRDAMERAAEDLEDNNCLESAHQLRAMLAATPQAADPIKRLIAMHNELLGEYPYCYFELAYTRRTDWMAWLCTKPREDDPERKVLACGQGLTAEEACAEAISAAQKGGEA